MGYLFCPRIDDETKMKIAFLVNAGYGFSLMKYSIKFLRPDSNELFKAAVDKYFDKVTDDVLDQESYLGIDEDQYLGQALYKLSNLDNF